MHVVGSWASCLTLACSRRSAIPTAWPYWFNSAGAAPSCTVSEAAECCPVNISVVSRHLAMLRDAGILHAQKRGREVYYSVRYPELAATLRAIADAIEACCPPEGCGNLGGEIWCGKTMTKFAQPVSEAYGRVISKPSSGGCCAGTVEESTLVKLAGYAGAELEALPPEAAGSSFGCGNPLAFSEVKQGDTVLDLGSGRWCGPFDRGSKGRPGGAGHRQST